MIKGIVRVVGISVIGSPAEQSVAEHWLLALASLATPLGLAYFACGALFAAAYVTALAGRLDVAAGHAPVSARLLFLPAAALLWPWLLVKLLFRASR